MATNAQWLAATRPRTLPATVAPVIVGWAVAFAEAHGGTGTLGWFAYAPLTTSTYPPNASINVVVALLAMLVAISLQVGVNYANDYSDGIRGTDEVRVGPVRLVGQGLAPAHQVKLAAFSAFGVAALAGLIVVLITGQWILIAVGALAIVSAWFYTGGKHPYGYAGLGELFVFVWFGLVAVQGTVYVLLDRTTTLGWVFGVGAGALSCALLVTNNLRDVPTDVLMGKRTLAVILGERNSRAFYIVLIWMALVAPFVAIAMGETRWLALALAAALSAHKPGWAVIRGARGRDLLPVLADTGRTLLVWAVSIAVALGLGHLGS
jgi:1,4-dihydroxy-2-naphthoate octaprenyltransferase